MKAPEELNLSPEQGEALIERIEHEEPTAVEERQLSEIDAPGETVEIDAYVGELAG